MYARARIVLSRPALPGGRPGARRRSHASGARGRADRPDGAVGSGKTTLLTTLAGLLPPASGQVLVRGVPLAENPGLRRESALVLQSYGLLTLLTAAENIEVVLRAAGRDPRQAIADAAGPLEPMRLAGHADHLIEELSAWSSCARPRYDVIRSGGQPRDRSWNRSIHWSGWTKATTGRRRVWRTAARAAPGRCGRPGR